MGKLAGLTDVIAGLDEYGTTAVWLCRVHMGLNGTWGALFASKSAYSGCRSI